ncbi:hypothetical protein LTR74_017835 [Friedmanniomyces endolithicus]|nr:hypothetical protein LTR74_017835 [Friedmanniomyces endolithicus]
MRRPTSPERVAQVSFNVNATTFVGENIYVTVDAYNFANGDIGDGAMALAATNYPIWSAVVDL